MPGLVYLVWAAAKTGVQSVAQIAFKLRLRPGRIHDYDEAHQYVPLQMQEMLKSAGISNFSIFRRDVDVFLYMQVDNFKRAWSLVDRNPVNQLWQERMSSLFEPMPELEPGERFPMMRQVFYLE